MTWCTKNSKKKIEKGGMTKGEVEGMSAWFTVI